MPAGELVRLRPIDIDDWSDVRYVHAGAFRTFIGPRIASHHAEEFMSALAAPEYAERLGACDLTGAWVDGQLAGTAGWRATTDDGRVARIEGLFVLPLFTFMGLGSLLLAHAEARARRAGCVAITALATCHAVPFFLRSGYDVYSQGPGISGLPRDMPGFLMRKQQSGASKRTHGSAERSWQGAAVAHSDEAALVVVMAPKPDSLLVDDRD
jgi:GNAT superfamily N-acetyltransferase